MTLIKFLYRHYNRFESNATFSTRHNSKNKNTALEDVLSGVIIPNIIIIVEDRTF